MALRTLGQRTFAALTFGALTLHGIATVTPAVTPGGGGSAYHRQEDRSTERYRQRQEKDEIEIVTILSTLIHEGFI